MKYGDCIRCGHCCKDMPCGLATGMECEHLSVDAVGVHTCAMYPFDHLDGLTRACLDAGGGCGYDGENDAYRALWRKLKSGSVL